jgi:hypothetical protein
MEAGDTVVVQRHVQHRVPLAVQRALHARDHLADGRRGVGDRHLVTGAPAQAAQGAGVVGFRQLHGVDPLVIGPGDAEPTDGRIEQAAAGCRHHSLC